MQPKLHRGKCKSFYIEPQYFKVQLQKKPSYIMKCRLKLLDGSADHCIRVQVIDTQGIITNQAQRELEPIIYFSTLFPIVGIPASSNTTVSVDPLSNFIYPVIHGMQHMSPVSSHQSMAATSYHQTGTYAQLCQEFIVRWEPKKVKVRSTSNISFTLAVRLPDERRF